MAKFDQVDDHSSSDREALDMQWVHLILEAKEMGLSLDEVKAVLKTAAVEPDSTS